MAVGFVCAGCGTRYQREDHADGSEWTFLDRVVGNTSYWELCALAPVRR